MAKWYDPITERWHTMPEPVKREPTVYERFLDELEALRAGQRQRDAAKTWEAVTATATATQMSQEAECPAESIP